jgi:hypothetical protein
MRKQGRKNRGENLKFATDQGQFEEEEGPFEEEERVLVINISTTSLLLPIAAEVAEWLN